MQYEILKSHSAEELEKRVTIYITEGYEPIGGIAVTSESTDCRYQNLFCQAVLKRDKIDEGHDPEDPNKPVEPDTPIVPDPDNPNPDEPEGPSEGGDDPNTGEDEGDNQPDGDELGNLRLFK